MMALPNLTGSLLLRTTSWLVVKIAPRKQKQGQKDEQNVISSGIIGSNSSGIIIISSSSRKRKSR
jgi:hypothetical protein